MPPKDTIFRVCPGRGYIPLYKLWEGAQILPLPNVVWTLNPKKCNFNAPAIRKKFFSKHFGFVIGYDVVSKTGSCGF